MTIDFMRLDELNAKLKVDLSKTVNAGTNSPVATSGGVMNKTTQVVIYDNINLSNERAKKFLSIVDENMNSLKKCIYDISNYSFSFSSMGDVSLYCQQPDDDLLLFLENFEPQIARDFINILKNIMSFNEELTELRKSLSAFFSSVASEVKFAVPNEKSHSEYAEFVILSLLNEERSNWRVYASYKQWFDAHNLKKLKCEFAPIIRNVIVNCKRSQNHGQEILNELRAFREKTANTFGLP